MTTEEDIRRDGRDPGVSECEMSDELSETEAACRRVYSTRILYHAIEACDCEDCAAFLKVIAAARKADKWQSQIAELTVFVSMHAPPVYAGRSCFYAVIDYATRLEQQLAAYPVEFQCHPEIRMTGRAWGSQCPICDLHTQVEAEREARERTEDAASLARGQRDALREHNAILERSLSTERAIANAATEENTALRARCEQLEKVLREIIVRGPDASRPFACDMARAALDGEKLHEHECFDEHHDIDEGDK